MFFLKIHFFIFVLLFNPFQFLQISNVIFFETIIYVIKSLKWAQNNAPITLTEKYLAAGCFWWGHRCPRHLHPTRVFLLLDWLRVHPQNDLIVNCSYGYGSWLWMQVIPCLAVSPKNFFFLLPFLRFQFPTVSFVQFSRSYSSAVLLVWFLMILMVSSSFFKEICVWFLFFFQFSWQPNNFGCISKSLYVNKLVLAGIVEIIYFFMFVTCCCNHLWSFMGKIGSLDSFFFFFN